MKQMTLKLASNSGLVTTNAMATPAGKCSLLGLMRQCSIANDYIST